MDFDELHEMWSHSPADAEFIWGHMKREGRREFVAGHLAAAVFEPVDWMRSAWERAKFHDAGIPSASHPPERSKGLPPSEKSGVSSWMSLP